MEDKMVYSIMSRNMITIKENGTVRQAVALMDAKRIRHLPVVDWNGRIIGILSDRDIRGVQDSMRLSEPVKKYMNFPILETKAADMIGSAVKRMLDKKISCLLVVDEFAAPCGIVTTDDIMKYFMDFIDGSSRELTAPIGSIFEHLKVPTYE